MSEPVTDKPATIFWPVTLMITSLVGWVAFTEFVISVRDRQYAGTEPARIIDVSDMAVPELELKKVPLQSVDMRQPEAHMASAYSTAEESPQAAPASVQRTPGREAPGTGRRVSPIFQATTF